MAALIEMAGASPPLTGRSLNRRKRPRPRPRGSIADLTAALGQAGLQLPVECGCDCSCDVQNVAPLVAGQATTSTPAGESEPAAEGGSEAPSPTEGGSEAPTESPPPPSTTTTTTTTTTPTEPG